MPPWPEDGLFIVHQLERTLDLERIDVFDALLEMEDGFPIPATDLVEEEKPGSRHRGPELCWDMRVPRLTHTLASFTREPQFQHCGQGS